MQKSKYQDAKILADKCFTYLLENDIAIRDPYRLYANTGLIHLMQGEGFGLVLWGIAHDINPQYDFPLSQFERVAKREFLPELNHDDVLSRAFDLPFISILLKPEKNKRAIKKDAEMLLRTARCLRNKAMKLYTDDPAIRYLQWLSSLKIKYHADTPRPTIITKF